MGDPLRVLVGLAFGVLHARPEEPTQTVTLRTGHNVDVQMRDGLADHVVDGDERALGPEARRDRVCDALSLGEHRRQHVGGQVGERHDVLARYDQGVALEDRAVVEERDSFGRLVHYGCGDRSGDDVAEDTVGHLPITPRAHGERSVTRAWTHERLARTALRRQFPRIRGRGQAAVVEAYRRLGPIQTQVPRAAHVALASRLPGVTYDAITEAFEAYDVVKASNLRGTVHTSTAEQHGWLASSRERPRDLLIANHLKVADVQPREVTGEIERYARGEWRERKDIVAHMWDWLDQRGAGRSNGATSNTMSDSLFWGHAHLVRRPRDTAWERRTDVYHQAAATVFDAEPVDVDEAIERLVRLHLSAYGPATRRDIAWWLGSNLTPVDDAVARLGDEIVWSESDVRDPYLDLAEPPKGGADPGTRLLPEFDGLILGYAPENRDRFAQLDEVKAMFATANGLMPLIVLHDGRIVATWKPLANGNRVRIEVRMLPGHSPLREEELAGPVGDVEAALAIEVDDVDIAR